MMTLSVMTLPLLPMPEIPGLKREKNTQEKPSLSDIYSQIKEAGIDQLDISSMDFQYGGEAAVLAAMEQTNTRCSCYLAFISAPMPTDAGNAAAIAQGKEAVDQALRLGTRVMMFVPAGYQDAVAVMSRQELADTFISVLRPVVAYASEKGVTVVIEDAPHREFPMCSQEELSYLLSAVPGLRLVYDSGNMLFAGEDPLSYYEHFQPLVAHGHLKDIAKGQDGTLMECTHGSGMVDFNTLLGRMQENQFEGVLAIELSPDFEGKSSVKDRVSHAANYFSALMEGVTR